MRFRDFLNEDLLPQARNLSFGIEIEVALDVDLDRWDRVSDRVMFRIEKRLSRLNLDWVVEEDASCKPGVEIHTVGANGTDQIGDLVDDVIKINDIFNNLGLEPVQSANCGLHIHIGGLDEADKSAIKKAMVNGLSRYYALLVSPARRERIRDVADSKTAVPKVIKDMDYAISGKKFMVLDRGKTMEFRFFQSTLMADVIGVWVELVLNLCAVAHQLAQQIPNLSGLAKTLNVSRGDLDWLRKGRHDFIA